jgi:hypothetical protein
MKFYRPTIHCREDRGTKTESRTGRKIIVRLIFRPLPGLGFYKHRNPTINRWAINFLSLTGRSANINGFVRKAIRFWDFGYPGGL